ncbi:MAG TPA: glycosyltransferase family 4 protein [Steroidobacteraceae bacterium]
MTLAPHRSLHSIQVGFYNDPADRLPRQLLDAWPTLVDVAEAARQAGIRVSLVQASSHRECLERNGVRYHFLPFGGAPSAMRKNAALGELFRRLDPDIFHVHGLMFPRELLALAALAPGVPILLQDHASRPPRIWRRGSWRRGLSVAAGIMFCAMEQARPFAAAGLVSGQTQLYEIPESTSRFSPGDPVEARRITGLAGEPAVLWVGHLNANKDPLTVLQGISAAARSLPRLQLHCCFGAAPLLQSVQARIAADPELRDRVHLHGRVSHDRVEQLMRAADLFVLGSHREGSGYSLIEALACGLPPIVTDIPSFRSLTGGGAVGMLWPCDDPQALCRALLSIVPRASAGMRAAVRDHFERELSLGALGLKLAAMYEDAVRRARDNKMAPRIGNTARRPAWGALVRRS